MGSKKHKYIQAPTSDDLVRIEAGEKFSDITNGPIKKALSGALGEDLNEIEELATVEEQPIRKRRTTFKRSMYFSLGVFVSVMSLIGIIFTVNFSINTVKNIADNTAQKNEFAKYIYPLVVVDAPSFEEGTKPPIEVMLTSAIWNIIINKDKTKYENIDGYITVPASDVEVEATNLFGKGITFTHQTLGDTSLYFDYSEETKSYIVPVSPHYLPYSPKVEDIKKVNDSRFELKVGYYPPVQSWLPAGTKAVPDKYMTYILEKQGKKYSIISIKENADTSAFVN